MKGTLSSRSKHAPPPCDDFHVIGLGLPMDCRERLTTAFPKSVLYTPEPDMREQTNALFALLGHVVVFTYIPGMLPHMLLRVSATYNQQEVKVIGLHPRGNKAVFDMALEIEFSGVVDVGSDPETYRRAARSVHGNELWFPRGYLSHRVVNPSPEAASGSLTQREADILRLLASGATNQAIAEGLYVSRDTVRWHLRSIYAKLGVSSREAAFRFARNKFAVSQTVLHSAVSNG